MLKRNTLVNVRMTPYNDKGKVKKSNTEIKCFTAIKHFIVRKHFAVI